MACACKVNQQLTYLQKKYGTNQPIRKDAEIRISLSSALWKMLIVLLAIPLSPLFLVYVIVKGVIGKPIKVDKLFKIGKKNVRDK